LELNSVFSAETATFFLFASPSQLYKELSTDLKGQFFELRNVEGLPILLRNQVTQLRYDLLNLTQCETVYGSKVSTNIV